LGGGAYKKTFAMDNINLSLEQLGRLTGKTPDELQTSLFVDGEEGKVLAEDAEAKLSTFFSSKFKSVGDDFHKKGFKQAWEKIGEITSKDPDFDPKGRQGEELLSAYIQFKAEQAAKRASTLSEEDLEKNPLVSSFLEKRTQAQRQKVEELKSQFEREKGEFLTQTKRTIARSKLVEAIPPGSLGDDQDEAKRRLAVLFELLDNRLDFVVIEGGETKLVDPKTHEPLTDAELNPVRYSDWVQTFNPFPSQTQTPGRQTPGAKTSQPGISGDIRVTSKEDYERQLAKAGTRQERAAVNNAYADFLLKNSRK
jgi:hypothetical protein